MQSAKTSLLWSTGFVFAVLACTLAIAASLLAQQSPSPCSSTSTGSSVVMWQRIPGHTPDPTGAIEGVVCDVEGHTLPGVKISLLRSSTPSVLTNGEGIFRLLSVPPGNYQLRAEKESFSSIDLPNTQVTNGELLTVQLLLPPLAPPFVSNRVPGGLPGSTGLMSPESVASMYWNPLADAGAARFLAAGQSIRRSAS